MTEREILRRLKDSISNMDMEGAKKACKGALAEGVPPIRDKVKVIIGGAPVTEDFAKIIGADAYGPDAVKGANICREWIDQQ